MPEFKLQGDLTTWKWTTLDSFVKGYVEAMFFTEPPMDSPDEDTAKEWSFDDLSHEALEACVIDCDNFRADPAIRRLTNIDKAQAGHDFWLTRNRHGAGFWDGDWDKVDPDRLLDKRAKLFSEVRLERGDDGQLHLSGPTPEPILFDLGGFDLEKVRAVYLRSESTPLQPDGTYKHEDCWLYAHKLSGVERGHDPMDRVGGPYHISAIVDDDFDGSEWFLFAVVDCYFPCHDLVRADSFEDAYEKYIDWAAENRGIKFDDADIPPNESDEWENICMTSNGVPVDTDNIQGFQVWPVRFDF